MVEGMTLHARFRIITIYSQNLSQDDGMDTRVMAALHPNAIVNLDAGPKLKQVIL